MQLHPQLEDDAIKCNGARYKVTQQEHAGFTDMPVGPKERTTIQSSLTTPVTAITAPSIFTWQHDQLSNIAES